MYTSPYRLLFDYHNLHFHLIQAVFLRKTRTIIIKFYLSFVFFFCNRIQQQGSILQKTTIRKLLRAKKNPTFQIEGEIFLFISKNLHIVTHSRHVRYNRWVNHSSDHGDVC